MSVWHIWTISWRQSRIHWHTRDSCEETALSTSGHSASVGSPHPPAHQWTEGGHWVQHSGGYTPLQPVKKERMVKILCCCESSRTMPWSSIQEVQLTSLPTSSAYSMSSSCKVSMWSLVKAMGTRIMFFRPRCTRPSGAPRTSEIKKSEPCCGWYLVILLVYSSMS